MKKPTTHQEKLLAILRDPIMNVRFAGQSAVDDRVMAVIEDVETIIDLEVQKAIEIALASHNVDFANPKPLPIDSEDDPFWTREVESL